MFRFFYYIWSIDSGNLSFILFFERKHDKFLTFNIVHFPNFEINASLLLALHLAVSKFNKRRGRFLEEMRYSNNVGITYFNPFVHNAPFLYPLKTSESRKVFQFFQEVEKGCIGNEWVNIFVAINATGISYPQILF